MRLTNSIITGLVVALVAITSSFTLKSDVPGEFRSLHLVEKNYQPIVGGTVLEHLDFTVPPNIQDSDDGYHKISLGFPFEYNGEVYTDLWICINGFVTFHSILLRLQLDVTSIYSYFRELTLTYPLF